MMGGLSFIPSFESSTNLRKYPVSVVQGDLAITIMRLQHVI
jgi:hypothetical protein